MESKIGRERIQAWQRGDLDAIGPLVESLSRPMIAFAYRFTGDWELARDLSQEAWLKADRAIPRFDLDRRFRPWIFTILRRLCLSHLRRKGRGVEIPMAAHEHDVPESRQAASRSLERREFWRLLARALPCLSDRQRSVFTLVDLQETPPIEAAERLEMNSNTLRATLHQARRKLANALRRMETEP